MRERRADQIEEELPAVEKTVASLEREAAAIREQKSFEGPGQPDSVKSPLDLI